MENIENAKTVERLTKLEDDVQVILGSIEGAARLQCAGLLEYFDRLVGASADTIYVASFNRLAKSKGQLEALQTFAKETGFKIKEILNPEQEQA